MNESVFRRCGFKAGSDATFFLVNITIRKHHVGANIVVRVFKVVGPFNITEIQKVILITEKGRNVHQKTGNRRVPTGNIVREKLSLELVGVEEIEQPAVAVTEIAETDSGGTGPELALHQLIERLKETHVAQREISIATNYRPAESVNRLFSFRFKLSFVVDHVVTLRSKKTIRNFLGRSFLATKFMNLSLAAEALHFVLVARRGRISEISLTYITVKRKFVPKLLIRTVEAQSYNIACDQTVNVLGEGKV